MAQQGDPDPSAGQLNPIVVEHSGVELAPAGDGSAADLGADDQESPDAAAALKAAAKEAAGGMTSGWFEYELPGLVDTPGGLQTIESLFVFFLAEAVAAVARRRRVAFLVSQLPRYPGVFVLRSASIWHRSHVARDSG